ncbi:MAG TPA: ATP synthase F1 subunit delta [Lachnospiraceae bacterium]|nr:ATP synthase F1 subunit delta [Lachnospiraceae bacterium]
MAREIESVYGGALFEAAVEKGRLRELYEEAGAVIIGLDDNPELVSILENPSIDSDKKEELLKAIFSGRVDELIANTLMLAVEKGHSRYLTKILNVFIKAAMKELGIGEATVRTAFDLSDAQKKQVEDKILTTAKFNEVIIDYKVDKSLIGGMIIKIGDRVVDSSIANQLESLRKSLMKGQQANEVKS